MPPTKAAPSESIEISNPMESSGVDGSAGPVSSSGQLEIELAWTPEYQYGYKVEVRMLELQDIDMNMADLSLGKHFVHCVLYIDGEARMTSRVKLQHSTDDRTK